MITVKTPQEIEILAEGGKILASVLTQVAAKAAPGVSAKELDDYAKKLIKNAGGKPALLGYRPGGARASFPD